MKTKRLLLLLTAALLLPVASKAQTEFSADGVTYTVTGTATVAATGGASTLTTLTIPETVTHQGKTYTVTHIGDEAFKDCPLTEVTLPSTLLSFGSQPFNGSNGLTITCYAVQAPVCTIGSRIATDRDKCTLRVPAIAFDDYTKWAWNNYSQYYGYAFQTTEYLDYEPKTVFVHSDFSFSRVPYSSPDVQMLLSPGTGQLTVDQPMSFGSFSMQADLRYRLNPQNTLICNNKATASAVELTIQLYPSQWNFFTLPFDVDAGAISPDGSGRTYIRRYDSEARAAGRMDETWVDVEPGETLHAYQGYILFNRSSSDDLALTLQAPGNGGIFMARTVSTSLQQYPSEYAQDANWNFLGNPYPCYYDVRALGITNPITVREFNSYYSVSPLDDAYMLSPFQAFFIQSEAGMGSLSFPLEGRSHSSRGTTYARQVQQRRAQAAGQREVLNILLESSLSDFTDRTRLVVNEAATAGYEISRDAVKFMDADGRVQQVYTVADGTCYAINERPQGDGVATLGMTIAERGQYTLRMQTQSTLPVTLVDHETGLSQPFSAGDSYTFTAEAGTLSDRFTLRFGSATGISQTADNEPADKQQPLYNLSGQRVNAAYKGIVIRGGKKHINP